MSVFTSEVIVEPGTSPLVVDGSGVTQPVSGTVTANAGTGPFPVSDNGGSLTVDGTVAVSGSVAVTGPLTDAQLRATPVNVFSTPTPASSSTVTLVTATGSNITLLAANSNRKKAIIHVEGATQYIKLGAAASSTSYTYKITANNTLIEITGYTGIIDSNGTSGKVLLVTELV